VIKSEQELMEERLEAQRIKEEKERKQKERILKMKELEKRAAHMSRKSDAEIAAEAKRNALRSTAEEKMNQNSGVVKLLSSMAQRAAAFTVRDQQLEEKKRLEEIAKEMEKREDIMVEVS
jgi:hypothetical protein